jgi:hypothetical protein
MICRSSSGCAGMPRATITRMLSSHSSRESRERVTCVMSWQMEHFAMVSSAPLPGMSVLDGAASCAASGTTPAGSESAASAATHAARRASGLRLTP